MSSYFCAEPASIIYVTYVQKSAEKIAILNIFRSLHKHICALKARPLNAHIISISTWSFRLSRSISTASHVHLICILTAATYFIISVFLLLHQQNTRLWLRFQYMFAYNVLYACYVCPRVDVCAYTISGDPVSSRAISRYYCCCCALLDLRASSSQLAVPCHTFSAWNVQK